MPTTQTKKSGTCKWITRDLDEGLALLEITSFTKGGEVTARYWVERLMAQESVVGYKLTKMGGGESYVVRLGQDGFCECKDYQYRHAGQGTACKHVRSLTAALPRL
jgi:predicted nucleic acid-binding Zn finger protein